MKKDEQNEEQLPPEEHVDETDLDAGDQEKLALENEDDFDENDLDELDLDDDDEEEEDN